MFPAGLRPVLSLRYDQVPAGATRLGKEWLQPIEDMSAHLCISLFI
jgi:hypothetical protein